MRRANNKIVGGVVLLAIILVAVGYAAITNVTLNINGTAKSGANQSNFVVEFIGTPTTGGKGTTTATINASKKTEGTVEVSGLTAKGDTATATYTVKNQSKDLSADLIAEATSSNEDYFETICTLDDTTLKAGEETTLTVTIKLLKTPIDETKEDLTSNIGVSISAEPKQPGEEANAGSTTVTSKKPVTNPYLPEGFTKVEGTTLDNGLTIQDSTGNQYVWVEVPKTKEVYPTAGLAITSFTDAEYDDIESDLHDYTKDYRKNESNVQPTSFMKDDKYTGIEAKKLTYIEYNAQTNIRQMALKEEGWRDEYYSDAVTGLTSDQYTELKQKMLKSVYQNGGFYVGKYETGIENAPKTSGSADTVPTETAVIKQNAYPYNNVTCSQAQTLASNMESGKYTSSLMFGVQWDLVLKYLETKGTAQADLKTNSTTWGNYRDNLWNITNTNSKYAILDTNTYELGNWTSGAYGKKDSENAILLSTEASEEFSKQGIYDLAGNVWEWTLEYTSDSSSPCANRGGNFFNLGSNSPAANRYDDFTTDFDDIIGFRVSLY